MKNKIQFPFPLLLAMITFSVMSITSCKQAPSGEVASAPDMETIKAEAKQRKTPMQ